MGGTLSRMGGRCITKNVYRPMLRRKECRGRSVDYTY